ncbi:50S ribosomal protein L21e [Ignicoccus hospitalis]|uniref:Large ribosomal subunit protein eL21 n=1 Tax=Ignicoccus hospitalis (strain KIN4/I / DSM 18386 / JCM 14125) TaxID=453591 RepID=RL21_IGNH4|nr:50S ribosomal protein L21e [Ignicoccus hospitalis]A8AAK8.1 RecName: Full=Large ribosomal subunit protein eL21; AltName: Full=50S ribosomal protein L21e [Ignicoccus hospitalis KIN4/I]ABU81960.1 LSU ribosomal protein L21E [Ignicoccus hospitalis KIN4/I]HIH89881.1 50S ribosomal protein L21e [Desulfurococcaceae archaeon]
MVKAPKGWRHRTRHIYRKRVREKGAVPPLSLVLIDYKPGDKVIIDPNPAIWSGLPHRRFCGKVGEVVGKRGKAYLVKVRDGDVYKTIIVRPEHLRPFKQ